MFTRPLASLSLLALAHYAAAHGGHGESGPKAGETMQQYAQRHMSSEHHIDSFDAPSFFQLHDLNRDGIWDRSEIEAVYGVHHVYSQKKSKDDEEHQKKADTIVDAVLRILDSNRDGVVDLKELERRGVDALPTFDHMGAEGHHYDVESEFFLHHEEEFHSTPETQTDDSYNHPEDIEHFGHHEGIEREEAEREAKFAGVSVEEILAAQRAAEEEAAKRTAAQQDINNQQNLNAVDPNAPPARSPVIRVTPPEKQDPSVKYAGEKPHGEEWGTGDQGYKSPRDASDKLRKNLPYKYKFRRNWGDF
ncbi:hypothetical protein Agabi119p4_152 [Agaricus bisporus var. burnettii]|uniref:EF-hand domain-containing protein n=1 Tax=Agaricus bisporus var. burnettii TaxID=192524 RepID=A0A8H7KKS4_AGABI|nr:hypothetical protein Agabi119p4_152 [Agaricus bisporus var. burnettii]